MVASQLHLVRHGEVFNPEHVLYGRLPGFGLSELGRAIAQSAADELVARDRPVSALFASPLQRAQESAAPIEAAFALPIQTEPRIIEPTNRFEGMSPAMRNRALRNPKNWPWVRNPFQPSWGEAYTSITSRMIAAMNDAYDSVDDGDVIMVSHQLPIWSTHLEITGQHLWHDPRKRRCNLSSITTFERRGARFVEVGYEDPASELLASAVDDGAV
ncbi:histidine phosphatase family protein [Subtercola boreus]|uniref:Histidine phosphatase family protein n=1 Tax=Subtercola boreus TaxID=120213 RepID=A0A3E0WGJ4_9MICO|nr:histidine phosphatase family protein [Subtercola boreus]RFA23640.1 histidine phosphatase family protein [Subtercola boreus]RFA24034.1 histidine phosphatase family protein [Subtercola boreus]RFA29733.1 histidine phosphatase family protein [Subtercola boreus]